MSQQPQLERRFFGTPPTLQTREGADTRLAVIAGYAALFNVRTVIRGWFEDFEESIAPGAFARALKEQHDVRSLFNHDVNIVLGRTKNGTLVLREDEKGLWTETAPVDTQQARDVVENIRVGNVDQMSFAFVPKETKWTFSKDKKVLDHCEILDVDLYDISPVTFPAYEETSVELVEKQRKRASELHQRARTAWERASAPAEPVIVRGLCPEVVLLQVSVARRRAAA